MPNQQSILFPFDFTLEGPPISLQTDNRNSLEQWKQQVRTAANQVWTRHRPASKLDLELVVITLWTRYCPDADNIIKPIQDAIIGLVYEDDKQVVNVSSLIRDRTKVRTSNPPPKLASAIGSGRDMVFIRVTLPANEGKIKL